MAVTVMLNFAGSSK